MDLFSILWPWLFLFAVVGVIVYIERREAVRKSRLSQRERDQEWAEDQW